MDQLLRPEGPAEEPGRHHAMTTREPHRSPVPRENARIGKTAPVAMGALAPKPPAPTPVRASGSAAGVVGFAAVAVLGGAVAWSSGCRNEPPPGPSVDLPPRAASLPPPSARGTGPVATAVAVAVAPSASASASPLVRSRTPARCSAR